MSNNKIYSIPVIVFPSIKDKDWYILTPEQIDGIRTADDIPRKAKEKLKSERRPDMIIYDEIAEFTKDDMDKIAKVKESIDRYNKRRSEELLGPLFSDEVESALSNEDPIVVPHEFDKPVIDTNLESQVEIAKLNGVIPGLKNEIDLLHTEVFDRDTLSIEKSKELGNENKRLRKDLETLRLRIAGLGVGIDWEADMPIDNRVNLGVDVAKEDTYIGLAKETIGKVIGNVSEVIKLEDSDGNVIESFKNG